MKLKAIIKANINQFYYLQNLNQKLWNNIKRLWGSGYKNVQIQEYHQKATQQR